MSIERADVGTERTVVVIAYALHLFGAICGVPSIIGTVLNYVRVGYGGFYDTHHRYMIRTFWWSVFWVVLGWLTVWILIGWAIWFFAWLWFVYRHIKGLVALLNGETPD
jgi:uncharacterized membrane protein